MESIKTFLESSTIHGLTHISTNRKHARFFWVIVVTAGFTGAGVMIYHSFQDWNNSPIKTTIETRPIAEITFPKVTVCPPKNTNTDLNHDLLIAANISLDNDTRNELTNFAVERLQNLLHSSIMTNLSMLENIDRYYNWYQGFTKIEIPFYEEEYNNIHFKVSTSAPYGTISTKFFGDKFSIDNVDDTLDIYYNVIIRPSKNLRKLNTSALHIEIEKVNMKDLLSGEDTFFFVDDYINSSIKYFYRNYTKLGDNYSIWLKRKLTFHDAKKLNLQVMPGFKVTWYYTDDGGSKIGEDDPEFKYKYDPYTLPFVKFANIFHQADLNGNKIWRVVKRIQTKIPLDSKCKKSVYYHSVQDIVVEAIEHELKMVSSTERLFNRTDSRLITAAEMFLYLTSCSVEFKPWFIFYIDLFQNKSPSQILLTLNRILKVGKTPKKLSFRNIAGELFARTQSSILLKYNDRTGQKDYINVKGRVAFSVTKIVVIFHK